jgi:hypothetical protein
MLEHVPLRGTRSGSHCGTELAVLRATIHGTEPLTDRADSALGAETQHDDLGTCALSVMYRHVIFAAVRGDPDGRQRSAKAGYEPETQPPQVFPQAATGAS